jgi:hypothetical protein
MLNKEDSIAATHVDNQAVCVYLGCSTCSSNNMQHIVQVSVNQMQFGW